MDEKTIQRIKKLQALAERGVGGEKTTAQKKLAKLLKDIAACKADMKNDGVKVIKETDGLIIRAITLYCKAEFGFNNAAEQFRKSYDALKMRLSLSAEYNTAPQVSETDTNSTESGV